MAQSTARVPAPELFPGLHVPIDVTLIILEHSELIDLVTLCFLNRKWADTFENDNTIRRMMFRLPKEKTAELADDSEQATWVQEQWTRVQAKMKSNERSADEYWKHIRVNPLLSSEYAYGTQGYMNETYTFTGKVKYAFPIEQHLTQIQSQRNKTLIESMFATYPPITRVHLDTDRLAPSGGMVGVFPQFERMSDYITDCGLTVETLF
jgi:hypothetical protein